MAKNNKIIVMIATLLFTAVGLIISFFIEEVIKEQASSQDDGVIKDLLDLITTPGLLSGLIWLLLCIIVFYGVRQVVDEGENVGPISLFFLLVWLGAAIGLVIGNIVWLLFKDITVTLDLDLLVDTFAFNLTLALGPSFAAALGVTTKNR